MSVHKSDEEWVVFKNGTFVCRYRKGFQGRICIESVDEDVGHIIDISDIPDLTEILQAVFEESRGQT